MAYNSFTTEEELKKQQQAGQPSVGQPAESTALVSSSAAPGNLGAAGQSSGKGTTWTNLQTYLDKNAGQGTATTQRILDPKQTQIDNAVTSLNQDVSKAQAGVSGGIVQRNTALEDKLKTDPTNAVKDFQSYTSSAYKGPASYTPGSDVYGKFNGLTPKVNLDDFTNPGSIKKSIGDSAYTFGQGALDGYLMNSEGQGTIQSFNERNKDVLANRDASIKSVNDSIAPAMAASKANVGYAQGAADTSYADWLKKAQDTRYEGYDKGLEAANKVAELKLRAAGVAVPNTLNGFVSPNKDYSWQDSVDPATLAGLNALAGIDSDLDTNGFQKTNNQAVNFDWEGLDKYISDMRTKAKEQAKASEEVGPNTSFSNGTEDIVKPYVNQSAGTPSGLAGINEASRAIGESIAKPGINTAIDAATKPIGVVTGLGEQLKPQVVKDAQKAVEKLIPNKLKIKKPKW